MGDLYSLDSKVLSRKDFIAAMGVSAAGLLAAASLPTPALASEQNVKQPSILNASTNFRITTVEEIEEMWEKALENAEAHGGEVSLNDPHPSMPTIVPLSSVSATVQADIVIGAIPDVVYLLARYESNGSRISQVYDKYAYGFQSSCEFGTYSHVIADGGRTLVINATVTLRNIVGFAQSLRLHGEFGPNGGNYLSAAYI